MSVSVSFKSHDRLQVYGGHTDMIMCMTIHKSMVTPLLFTVLKKKVVIATGAYKAV